jgi:hypothetical protein
MIDCLLHQQRITVVGHTKRSPGLLHNVFLDVECDVPVIPPRVLDQSDRVICIGNVYPTVSPFESVFEVLTDFLQIRVQLL